MWQTVSTIARLGASMPWPLAECVATADDIRAYAAFMHYCCHDRTRASTIHRPMMSWWDQGAGLRGAGADVAA